MQAFMLHIIVLTLAYIDWYIANISFSMIYFSLNDRPVYITDATILQIH